MNKTFQRALFIFRKDLLLEDNTGLIFALKSAKEVITCFIFTPMQIDHNPYRSDHFIIFAFWPTTIITTAKTAAVIPTLLLNFIIASWTASALFKSCWVLLRFSSNSLLSFNDWSKFFFIVRLTMANFFINSSCKTGVILGLSCDHSVSKLVRGQRKKHLSTFWS